MLACKSLLCHTHTNPQLTDQNHQNEQPEPTAESSGYCMCIRPDLSIGQFIFLRESQNVAHYAVVNGLCNTKSTICVSATAYSVDDALDSATPCRLHGKGLAVDVMQEQHKKLTCRREGSLWYIEACKSLMASSFPRALQDLPCPCGRGDQALPASGPVPTLASLCAALFH